MVNYGFTKLVFIHNASVDSDNYIVAIQSGRLSGAARNYIGNFRVPVVALALGHAKPWLLGVDLLLDRDSGVSKILLVRNRFLSADIFAEDFAHIHASHFRRGFHGIIGQKTRFGKRVT